MICNTKAQPTNQVIQSENKEVSSASQTHNRVAVQIATIFQKDFSAGLPGLNKEIYAALSLGNLSEQDNLQIIPYQDRRYLMFNEKNNSLAKLMELESPYHVLEADKAQTIQMLPLDEITDEIKF